MNPAAVSLCPKLPWLGDGSLLEERSHLFAVAGGGKCAVRDANADSKVDPDGGGRQEAAFHPVGGRLLERMTIVSPGDASFLSIHHEANGPACARMHICLLPPGCESGSKRGSRTHPGLRPRRRAAVDRERAKSKAKHSTLSPVQGALLWRRDAPTLERGWPLDLSPALSPSRRRRRLVRLGLDSTPSPTIPPPVPGLSKIAYVEMKRRSLIPPSSLYCFNLSHHYLLHPVSTPRQVRASSNKPRLGRPRRLLTFLVTGC